MLHAKIVFWVFAVVNLPLINSASRLNEFIQHFEPLSYSAEEVHSHHLRAKRSPHSNPFVHINFHAHGRHFNLRLKRDLSVFAEDLVVDTPNGILENYDTSHIYEGVLWGDENTRVFGAIRDGIFEGKIQTPQGSYYMEHAKQYFRKNENIGFHSLIYHERDIVYPHDTHGGCGVKDEVLKWMEKVSHQSVANNDTKVKQKSEKNAEKPTKKKHDYPFLNKYSEDAQKENSTKSSSRSKRELQKKRACSLYIQTDTLLWEHIHDQERDPMKTREEITSLIAQHVKAVNFIYENTDFNSFRGIKFVVQRITINDSSACNTTEKQMTNPFCSLNIDVSNFLNLNSQISHDAFCLAYVFTYRDFSGGTLGLAWVASPQGASGGICEKYKPYTENVGGRTIQTKRSLNTGIITFVNYNTRVPPKVSQLTLAHEIGHNFGSPHDYPLECKPGGSEGNFIMFASATSGDRPNNSRFSPCSVNNISAVLRAVHTYAGGKTLCLEDDRGAFCGNKIVEDGEECDCGYNMEECDEQCCYPRTISDYDREHNSSAFQCNRRQNTQCSPSEGPCCKESCDFESPMKLCRLESECSFQSYCNGKSASCPPSNPKPNTTECNENTRVCISGECVGSICMKYKMEECFLSRKEGASPEKLCELACQQMGNPNSCSSIHDHLGSNFTGIKLRPGSPCDNFQGYCDVFQKCRAVDAEGPLARLKNLLFNQNTLTTIAENVTKYWWAVLMTSIAFIILMAMFIKCCAVHTPSSNPKQPPALRITDTLRRPAQTLRRKRNRHHQTAPQMSQAPPPYPGLAAGPSQGGPARGYGEGRGHYNRPKGGNHSSWTADDPYAAAYPGRNLMEMRHHKV